ncbi:hypothetical protein GUF51_07645, partial [Xanthomonas citri pv. citri]|nr:hypothetical protein [Xanthomonas citri pv. citri]
GANKVADIGGVNLHKCVALETLFLPGNQLVALPSEALLPLESLMRVNIVKDNAGLDLSGDDAQKLVAAIKARCSAKKGRWIE